MDSHAYEKQLDGVAGQAGRSSRHVRLHDDVAWKLLFNALPESELASNVRVTGRHDLAAPLLRARSVIV